MSHYRHLAFLTDHGLEGGFDAGRPGVVTGIMPEARIVDVSHVIPAYDVLRGARVLARLARYLLP